MIQKTAVFPPSAQCASKRPCTSEKDKPDHCWPVANQRSYWTFHKGKYTDLSVLDRLYNTSETKSRTLWIKFCIPHSVLGARISPGVLWIQMNSTNQSCIGLGPRFSSLLDLLSAVHWEIHPQQMGFCSGLVLMLWGEWAFFELQRVKWKSKSNKNPKWSCPWADVFRPQPSKSMYKKTLTTIGKQIVGTLCTSRKELQKWGKNHFVLLNHTYLLNIDTRWLPICW